MWPFPTSVNLFLQAHLQTQKHNKEETSAYLMKVFNKCINSCIFFVLGALEWITVTSVSGISPDPTWIWKAKRLLRPFHKIFALYIYQNLKLHWLLSFVSRSLCFFFLIIVTVVVTIHQISGNLAVHKYNDPTKQTVRLEPAGFVSIMIAIQYIYLHGYSFENNGTKTNQWTLD